jgi:hypothetical protein
MQGHRALFFYPPLLNIRHPIFPDGAIISSGTSQHGNKISAEYLQPSSSKETNKRVDESASALRNVAEV